jgi:hypothetical protein
METAQLRKDSIAVFPSQYNVTYCLLMFMTIYFDSLRELDHVMFIEVTGISADENIIPLVRCNSKVSRTSK